MESSALKCSVCNHHHEQVFPEADAGADGVKCEICGHTGKSRLYQALQNKPPAYAFLVQGFDWSSGAEKQGLWQFTRILRKRIFADDPLPDDDAACRHLVAFVGEAPIGIARWRLVPEQNGQIVLIERIGILEAKRKRGYGKQLLQAVMQDIQTTLTQVETTPIALVAYIPEQDAEAPVKLFGSSGFQIDQARHDVRYVSSYRLTLPC